jgi:hypothetical protein
VEAKAVIELMERRGWIYRVGGFLFWTGNGRSVSAEEAVADYQAKTVNGRRYQVNRPSGAKVAGSEP